jgi:hypothetical protein
MMEEISKLNKNLIQPDSPTRDFSFNADSGKMVTTFKRR